MQIDLTARDILFGLPDRLNSDKIEDDTYGLFHFLLSGDGGGEYTVKLEKREVTVSEGLQGEATCEITTAADTFVELETGKLNPQMAFMLGKIKLSNIGEMLKFVNVFSKAE